MAALWDWDFEAVDAMKGRETGWRAAGDGALGAHC